MSLRITIKRLLLAASIAAAATGVQAEPAPASETNLDMTIEEIVVTAQKREENMQNVPIAVSAYSQRMRDLVGIKGIEELIAFTPGASYSSLDRLSIRGIGRLTNQLGSDPGVATYADGFYTSTLTDAGKSSLFVDRVEVLRGPQGTLYGRNSVGGAVNVISRRPTEQWESEARLQVGDYQARKIEATVSGPITDKLRVRLSGQQDVREEGYIHNLTANDRNTRDRELLEAQFAYDFTSNFKGWVKYTKTDWSKDNADGAANSVAIDPWVIGTIQGANMPNALYFTAPTRGNLTNPSVNDPYVVDTNDNAFNTLDGEAAVANLDLTLGAAKIKWIGGWGSSDFAVGGDTDTTSLTGGFSDPQLPTGRQAFPQYVSSFGQIKDYYSNELNITSNSDGKLEWIFGLYQFHEKEKNPIAATAPNQVELDSPVAIRLVNGVPTAVPTEPLGDRAFLKSLGEVAADSYAAFAQFDYAITDKFKTTVGVRYSQDEKAGAETVRTLAWGSPTILGLAYGPLAPLARAQLNAGRSLDLTPVVNHREFEDKWTETSGRLGFQYLPTESTMLYTSWSRGYKAGGFNLGVLQTQPLVEPETVNAYEIGVKTQIDKSLQINTSVFYYLYENAQIPVLLVNEGSAPGTPQSTFYNIPEVTTYGAEVEAVWAPTTSLRFTTSYSYLHATVTDMKGKAFYDLTTRVGENVEGNTMPQSPEQKVAFNGSYRMDFTPGSLTFSGTYMWQDETKYAVIDNPFYVAEAFGRADARLIWDAANDHYSVIAYGENLTDELGVNGATPSPTGGRIISLLPPRTYGLELQVRF
jgi:iron complex outermembrane receptor protein